MEASPYSVAGSSCGKLLDKINSFLSDHVFGDYRRQLLGANLRYLDTTIQQEREQQVAGLRRAIADIKIRRTIRNFELVDDPDEEFVRDINERRARCPGRRRVSSTLPVGQNASSASDSSAPPGKGRAWSSYSASTARW